MKKAFSMLVILCVVLSCAACVREEPTPSPAPALSAAPLMTPGLSPAVSDAQTPVMGGEQITGFTEGKQVSEADVPQVVQAVKGKYPDATITGITYATHADKQVYHVMLSGAVDTTEIYVDAQGNITPYAPATTPGMSPAVSPAAQEGAQG